MTGKIYKSAMGKPVDLGALILENENTRAVGNMNVNARGDVLDGANRVIDTKNRQVQRQYKKQATNTSATPVSTGTIAARRQKQSEIETVETETTDEIVEDILEIADEPVVSEPEPVAEETTTPTPVPRGGLAAALAKSQAVKQELMKTPRQLAQERAGVKKI